MKRLRDNSLSLIMLALFAIFLTGQVLTGHAQYNEDQEEHGEPPIGMVEYLGTGHFVEATFENWESEFLQMAAYVFLTAFLFQRGSSESKDPDEPAPTDEDPRKHARNKSAPRPVKVGGLVLVLYENSLFLAFVVLFLMSFALHALGGAQEYSQEQLAHGGSAVTVLGYLATSRFWFESFQNWQSEFLAVASIVAAVDLPAPARIA